MRPIHHGTNVWRDGAKPRAYRTDPTCKDKRRFVDEVGARAAGAIDMDEMESKRPLWIYRCRHCNGWHLTSSNQGEKFAIKL